MAVGIILTVTTGIGEEDIVTGGGPPMVGHTNRQRGCFLTKIECLLEGGITFHDWHRYKNLSVRVGI